MDGHNLHRSTWSLTHLSKSAGSAGGVGVGQAGPCCHSWYFGAQDLVILSVPRPLFLDCGGAELAATAAGEDADDGVE